ncbi:hypothetical protein [Pseudobdellovibrio sp. HCB154]|uniref:hypothetical protein n=1 Tax=Pseudobdellovibrio sp. HCB154 TaxID=3386277 RepID=UPI0039171324
MIKPILNLTVSSLMAMSTISVTPFSEPARDDDFKIFLDNQSYVSNIFSLQSTRLTQGHSQYEIWAGSYWPIHQGLLGQRYADPDFPKSKDYLTNYNDYLLRPSELLVIAGSINRLSPAEKYDLLVGDTNWTLTKAMWSRGQKTLQQYGYVPTWTGICHGWSAAAHMGVKAPRQSVVVTDVTGHYTIEFYKQDIKALMSYLWAESSTDSIQAGNRCRQDIVLKDQYQRPMDASCLDSNPMSWHLGVTNRIGMYQKSFVMDSTTGSEVWNFAVKGYDYSYFNPRTFETTHNLKAAVEPIENMTMDKYKNYRSPRAKYIVGVVMDAFIPSLITPAVNEGRNDRTKSYNFVYDLELDAGYNIIGGEWHSHARPDFIWSYGATGRAMTTEDLALSESWDLDNRLPDSYAARAIEASQKGKVLGRIAEALLNESVDE